MSAVAPAGASVHNVQLLSRAGVLLAPHVPVSAGRSMSLGQARTKARLAAAALNLAAAAGRAGMSQEAILTKVETGRLLAFNVPASGQLQLPVWQFSQGHIVPGLEQVLSALPRTWDHRDAYTFLSRPLDQLRDSRGVPRSALEHLAAGGDPELVVEYVIATVA